MRSRATVKEVASNFSEYIERVQSGERFVLVRDSEPVAELRPVSAGPRLRDLPDILASLPHLLPEDLDAFESDIEEARDEIHRAPIRDPWGS